VFVKAPPDVAFEVFTDGIASWWPMTTHSVSEEKTTNVTMEGREGGRLYETAADGAEHDWGAVTRWDPPRAVGFTWYPGRSPDTWQQVEVTFTPSGNGTSVELVHTGWERLGDDAATQYGNYDGGWDFVLSKYTNRLA
jgi:uncharacterized protein YndB with AHSA1/START domain